MSGAIKDSKKRKKLEKTTPEFRKNAARLVLDEKLSRHKVAEDLGAEYTSVCAWVASEQRLRDASGATKYASVDEENRALREENRILKLEREILKKATAFFAKESKS